MRLFAFILQLALIVGVAVWLADQPGTARIVWHDYVVETSAAFLSIAFGAGALVLFLVYRLWRFVVEGPRFWRLRRQIKKMRQGHDFVTQGLVALASGDAAEAGRLAVASRKNLGASAATQWLQAQAAQLAGDLATAKVLFQTLANDPSTAALGYRGLISAALKARKWDEAERYVEKLHHVKPKTPWLSLVRFELATHRHAWREAGEALAQASAARLLEAPLARRHQAALLVMASDEDEKRGHPDRALQAAEKAARLSPDWLPALAALAHQQMAMGHARAAQRTLEKAWAKAPHPQLAALARQGMISTRALDVYKHIQRLTRADRDHPASHRALAEAALSADLWGEARRHAMALANKPQATQGVFLLLAKLERRESGNDAAATRWLMKAVEAPPDPVWLCGACGAGHQNWRAVCKDCGAFDRLVWQTPGQALRQDGVCPALPDSSLC